MCLFAAIIFGTIVLDLMAFAINPLFGIVMTILTAAPIIQEIIDG